MVKVLAAQCPPDQRRVPAADQAVLLRPAPGGHPGRRAAQLHGQCCLVLQTSKTSNRRFVITEKAFTFKTLLRHYAKEALTPHSLNVKLGPRHIYHKGQAAIRHYANQPAHPF